LKRRICRQPTTSKFNYFHFFPNAIKIKSATCYDTKFLALLSARLVSILSLLAIFAAALLFSSNSCSYFKAILSEYDKVPPFLLTVTVSNGFSFFSSIVEDALKNGV
jgi:hypothetical protein